MYSMVDDARANAVKPFTSGHEMKMTVDTAAYVQSAVLETQKESGRAFL